MEITSFFYARSPTTYLGSKESWVNLKSRYVVKKSLQILRHTKNTCNWKSALILCFAGFQDPWLDLFSFMYEIVLFDTLGNISTGTYGTQKVWKKCTSNKITNYRGYRPWQPTEIMKAMMVWTTAAIAHLTPKTKILPQKHRPVVTARLSKS